MRCLHGFNEWHNGIPTHCDAQIVHHHGHAAPNQTRCHARVHAHKSTQGVTKILFQELNKCKTELQFWRSKSALISTSSSASTSPEGTPLPTLNFLGGPGIFTLKAVAGGDNDETTSLSGMSDASFSNDLKALANQGVFPPIVTAAASDNAPPTSEDEDEGRPGPSTSPRPVTRGSFSGPPSPGVPVPAPPATSGRGKRKAPADEPVAGGAECTRKSLRGQGVKGVAAVPTRNAHKRPKLGN